LWLLTGGCFAEAYSAPNGDATADEVEACRLRAEGKDAEQFSFDDSGLDGVVVDWVQATEIFLPSLIPSTAAQLPA
jgi:hypothetical protein